MQRHVRLRWWIVSALSAPGLWACGGGGGSSPAPAPAPNEAPVVTISHPLPGSTFAAGETLRFAGSATDAEDGTLAGSRLAWRAELHHDSHTHPFMPEAAGADGQVSIPVRGETSPNVFYRFHLRATDHDGRSTETTRDVLPRTVRITLQTSPAGLALTLDGQPVASPKSFTGVVGIERDVAAADQPAHGRRYRFDSWSDGGSASHIVATPASDTVYTANLSDVGAVVNQAPSITLTAPASATVGTPVILQATAADSDGQGAATTSAAVGVTVTAPAGDTQPPVASIDSPAEFSSGLAGTLSIGASATDDVGVASLEIQVDGQAVAGGTGSGSPHAVNVDTTAYASGQHVLRARARDAAGNTSAWASIRVEFGGSRSQPAGFTRSELAPTLAGATAFTQAPDGRLFIAEQGGALRVLANGALLSTPFISLSVDAQGERGLLGVTLHPQFATNRWIYLYYTTPENGTHNRISRFTASAADPNLVQPGSELRIADLPALSGATNHNGGALHFGLDGKLYVAVGDNNDAVRSPDLSQPFGKILRFNDDGTIPTDNPFYAAPATLADAIWARGLRNPFTFSVRASDGRIHINDVGQATWEEVDLGVPGGDYGWPANEGPTSAAGITAPLFAYDHDPAVDATSGFFSGCAVSGGAFYGASGSFPAAYRNSYFFADYCGAWIGRMDLAGGSARAVFRFGSVRNSPVDLLVGLDGSLYVLSRDRVTRFSSP